MIFNKKLQVMTFLFLSVFMLQKSCTAFIRSVRSIPGQTASSKTFAGMTKGFSKFPEIPIRKDKDKFVVPICTSFPTQGENSIIGKKMLAGMKNYLKGLKYFLKDTGNFDIVLKENNSLSGYRALNKIKKLLKISPLFVGLVGTETLLVIDSLLSKKKMTVLFPVDNFAKFKARTRSNVVYFRPSYRQELVELVRYSSHTLFKKKFAILYEESEWGTAILEELREVLKKEKLVPVAVASYPQGTVAVNRAIVAIAKGNPNAIICLANPRPAYSFIRNAINHGLHKSTFLGLSFLSTIQKVLRVSRGLDIITSSVVPNAATSKLVITKEYNKVMKKYLSFRTDSPFYLEGYINTALFVECLKKISGEVTVDNILATFNGFKDVNYKGLHLNFDKKNRTLSSTVWINPGINKKWIQVAK